MKKTKQTNSSLLASVKVIETIVEAIAAFYLMIVVMESLSTVERAITAAACFWLVVNVSLFFFRYVARPMAQAILSDS